MTKLNPKGTDRRIDTEVRLAGGNGAAAAVQSKESLLRRAVLANLLWEDVAYESGKEISNSISLLIPQVDPNAVAEIAIESREKQKLRHIPLFIIVEMAKYPDYRKLIRKVINKVIKRPDQMTDLLALYWKDGRKSLPAQMKLGLSDVCSKFDEYQFAKYDRDGKVKLRDVFRVVHPKPKNDESASLYKRVVNRTLATPETWEVLLSSGADKKESWDKLLDKNKLPALALLRNIKKISDAGVSERKIINALKTMYSGFLLPLNFFSANKSAPEFQSEIEEAMFKCYSNLQKLPGFTVFVMDVSGSMGANISSKSIFDRIDAGAAMAVVAREQCESCAIYATAGSDSASLHRTERLANSRGFSLSKNIAEARNRLGGGGIFTRQCLEYIEKDLSIDNVDRIIIFSDSQDCDRNKALPKPFGKHNYIIDVSANKRGIAYDGVWTAEISGWSENFLTYIAATEGLDNNQEDNN